VTNDHSTQEPDDARTPDRDSLPPEVSDETHIMRLNGMDLMDQVFNRFLAQRRPFGFVRQGTDVEYHPFPYVPGPDDPLLLKSPWRIELELQSADRRMILGLDLYGDVILGRGESRKGRIILDLDQYGAQEHGVSREHLMIRPTSTRLFAIDQGSTNGSTVNGVPLGRGIATELHEDDLIAMANMVLMLHIVRRPGQS
jgi:hypothetical protein